MKRYSLSHPAKSDLVGIYEYIRRDNPAAAQRVMKSFRETFRKLAANPHIGHLRDDLLSEPVRIWSAYSYLIIYRADPKPIEILRVLHGARDVPSAFERGV